MTRPAQKQAAAVNAGAALFGVETPLPAAQVTPAATVKSEPPKTLDTGAALFGVDSSVAAKAPGAQATASGAALFGVDPQAASEAPKQPEVSGTGAALFGVDPSAAAVKSEGSEVAAPAAAQATSAGPALFGVETPVATENAVPEAAPAVNILLNIHLHLRDVLWGHHITNPKIHFFILGLRKLVLSTWDSALDNEVLRCLA